MNKNKGFSLLKMIQVMVFLGFIAIYGLQIGMGYFQQQTIKKAVKTVLLNSKSDDNVSNKKIKDAILNRLSAENFAVSADDITVTKNHSGYAVEVYFIKEIRLNDQMKIVMDLEVKENSN